MLISGRIGSGGVLCVCVLMTVFFFGCASSQDVLYLNDRLAALDQRLTQMQEKVEKEQPGELSAVRATQTDMMTDLGRVKSEVQELRGMTEENQYLLKHGSLKPGVGEDRSTTGIEDLSRRVAVLEKGLRQVQGYLNLEETSEAPAAAPAEKPADPAAGERPPAVVEPVKPLPSDQVLYDQVLGEFRAGQYEKAIQGFNAFLAEYPKSSLADNAQFWIGESNMAQKQYEQAILAYQKVIKNYPNGNKVPSAMLRQALAFYEINDKTSSHLLLRQIMKKYPNSPEAKIAKSKLETLK